MRMSEIFASLNLAKGQTIPTDVVCLLSNVSMDDPVAVAIALMSFNKQLQIWLRKEGYFANCRVVKTGVRWLTDSESIPFNRRRARMGTRKIHNSKNGFDNVDSSELTVAERAELEKQSRATAALSLAVRRVSPLEFAKPSKRQR